MFVLFCLPSSSKETLKLKSKTKTKRQRCIVDNCNASNDWFLLPVIFINLHNCLIMNSIKREHLRSSSPIHGLTPNIRFLFVTGGVVSGLGKGITISSIGRLLKASGLRVTSIKIDPYLNTDAGTMSPFEHGRIDLLLLS